MGNISESRSAPWRRLFFGRPHSIPGAPDDSVRLELAISANGERVVISGRINPERVSMYRDEAIELLRLLGREFVLDAMSDL